MSNNCSVMPEIESVDGVKVYYEVRGDTDVPAILITGLGGFTGEVNFKHQLTLATKYQLIIIELPGQGRSGKNRAHYTMELYGHDVKAVMDQLELPAPILVGYSMGGPIIVEAAQLPPERVKGLVFVESIVSNPPMYLESLQEEKISEMLQPFEADFVTTWTKFLDDMITDAINPEEANEWKRLIPTLNQRAVLSAFAELLRWNGANALQQIDMPMKFIIAGQSMPETKDRERWSKRYDIAFLENVGHLLIHENPQAFNKLLEQRITELLV
jgi:pimeloyl-ACP methyl ester carboxylesterase